MEAAPAEIPSVPGNLSCLVLRLPPDRWSVDAANIPEYGYFPVVPEYGYFSVVPEYSYFSVLPDYGYFSVVPEYG